MTPIHLAWQGVATHVVSCQQGTTLTYSVHIVAIIACERRPKGQRNDPKTIYMSLIRVAACMHTRFGTKLMIHPSWLCCSPACLQDATETQTEYKLRIDLPGFSAEEVDIELQGDKLTISAKKDQANEGDAKVGHGITAQTWAPSDVHVMVSQNSQLHPCSHSGCTSGTSQCIVYC